MVEKKTGRGVLMKHIKVLIAEDSPVDVELLIQTLKTHYVLNFKCVETGEDFLNALTNDKWDVILADYNMPNFGAPEALSLLHQTGKDIPFIIVSGTIGEDFAVESLKSGAHDFITKANLSRLLPAIEREIKSAKVRHEKRLSEEALKESERRFREIFENASDGLLLVDVDTLKFSFGNSTICKMTGYEPNEITKLSVPDIHPKENLPYVANQLEKQIRNEIRIARDIPVKRKDGTVFFADINTFEMTYEGKKCLMGIFRDITERKLAEEALQKNERFLADIFNSIQDGISVLDMDLRIVRVNPTMENWYSYAMPVVGKKCFEVNHGHTGACADCPTNKTMKSGTSSHGIVPRIGADGSATGWLDLFSFPITDTVSGKMIGVIEYLRDITENKRIEEALKQSEEKYRSFFEEDLTGDFISTPAGKLLQCNPSFARMFGVGSVEDVTNSDFVKFFPNPEFHKKVINRLKSEKKIEYMDLQLQKIDGKPIYTIANLIGEFNQDNELVEVKGYLFDDTKRKILERQLIHSQKMESLGTLAGGIAHDFNNILGIIMGHASIIGLFKSEPIKVDVSAEAITRVTERGATLVRQLLTFARKTEVNLESVRVNDLIKELINILNETFPKTIEFNIQLEDQLPSIIADQNQLHSVLLNLCLNARDAMPDGGKLTITTRAVSSDHISKYKNLISNKYIAVEITDTGKGMEQATLERIFEPFFTTKELGKGTGLGLAVAYGIIEQHNSFIEAESKVGAGTVFRLYFPVLVGEVHTEKEYAGTIKDIRGGNETILLVEDEEYLAKSTKIVLQEKGYTVLTAQDGEEAIKIYSSKKEEISLVLSDLGLPRIDGQELFNRLKQANPELKFIVASGYIRPEKRTAMSQAGVKAFVQKPYKLVELLKIIRNVLD